MGCTEWIAEMSALDDLIARDNGKPVGSALDALIARDSAAVTASNGVDKPADGLMGQLKHQAGLMARIGGTALTSLPNMAGDAANSLLNIGIRGLNDTVGTNINQLRMPSEITQSAMTNAGVSTPQNMQERLVQAAGSAMGGTGTSVLLGNLLAKGGSAVAQAVGTGLQAAPGVQAVSSAASGLGGQGAAEAGMGLPGQLAGAILGGGTAGLASVGAKSLRTPSAATSQAKQLASALRDQSLNAEPMPIQAMPIEAMPTAAMPKPRLKLNIDGTVADASIPTPTPAPTLTPTATPTAATFIPPRPVPQGGMHPTQDQLANIALLKKIGLNEQRPATISGDKFASGIDYENSKLANPTGEVTRAQLAKEQDALKTYASGIVDKTGGQAPSPEAMGQTIRAPMQGLSDHFDNAIGQLYTAAKETAGDLGPVNPKSLNTLMGDHNFRETLLSSSDGTALLGSIDRQVKRFQGVPVPGEELPLAPNTVNSAENLRKWLNSQWSPSNSRLIGQVKQALDTDVATAGGSGVFDQARALHKLRMDTLDNPNGISKLLTSDGPKGINQAIPDELVGSKLLTMPTNQFGHIVKTITSLPEELQPAGQQALAEIKAELARRIYKAGDSGGTQNGPSVWNASNVTRELNANKSKMALVFSPEELDQFTTLHDAGHIIQTPMAYKGAAAQGYNYLQKGVLTGLPAGGAGIGALFGNALGAAAGSALGTGASVIAKGRIEASMAKRLAQQLLNPQPTFPK